jgi:transcriptional regulator with XRE-family HTH domain
MTFRENLNRICKERGTTLTQVVKKVGLSTSKVTAINNGSIPKEDIMLDLAKELDCSIMDFFADEGEVQRVKPTDEDEEDILRIYRALSRKHRHEVMSYLYRLEDGKEVVVEVLKP